MGLPVGTAVGLAVGSLVGLAVGAAVGFGVGYRVGYGVGGRVGYGVGFGVVRSRGLPGLPEDQRDKSGARVHPLPTTSDTDYNALDEGADAVKKNRGDVERFFPLHTEVSTPKMTVSSTGYMSEVFAKGICPTRLFVVESEAADR